MTTIDLVYFEPTDFDQLISWIPDEAALLQWGGPQFSFPLSRDQLMPYVARANDIQHSESLIYKAVGSDGKTVGHIALSAIDRNNRSARLGKILVGDPGRRGQGLGRRMVRQVLAIGFETLDLHRIELGVFDFNSAAIACYQACGFVVEGLRREARRYQATYWNLLEMSLLEAEWRNRGNRRIGESGQP
jgi:RimJ/RimL family protein N-acetyltransferase